MCGGAVGDRSPQGRLRAVLLHKAGRAVKLRAQRSGLSPRRTAAITLNHPPSSLLLLLLSLWPPLASTDLENICWVQATKSGSGLCFACKQQKYWANYKIIIWWWWQGNTVGVEVGLPGLPAGWGKMNQRLVWEKWTALIPACLYVFTTPVNWQTLAQIQASHVRCGIAPGNGPFRCDHLLSFHSSIIHIKLLHYTCAWFTVNKTLWYSLTFFRIYTTGRRESQLAYEGRVELVCEWNSFSRETNAAMRQALYYKVVIL